MPEQKPSKRLFLSQAASCTHRKYLRLSLTPPDGSELPDPYEEPLATAKGFRSNIHESRRSLEVYNQVLSYFCNKCQGKNQLFSLFLLKNQKEGFLWLFQLLSFHLQREKHLKIRKVANVPALVYATFTLMCQFLFYIYSKKDHLIISKNILGGFCKK